MVLRAGAAAGDVRPDLGLKQNLRKVEATRLPVIHRRFHVEPVHAPDHLVQRTEAEAAHQLAYLLRHEAEEVHHMVRVTGEFLAQLRVLGGDADRTGVEVAHAHHDATEHRQRRG